MNAVTPNLDAPLVMIAEDQPEFEPVRVALVREPAFHSALVKVEKHGVVQMNTIVMAFKPTPEERELIAKGEDIYISLLTFGKPQQAIYVDVGPETPSMRYNVKPGRKNVER